MHPIALMNTCVSTCVYLSKSFQIKQFVIVLSVSCYVICLICSFLNDQTHKQTRRTETERSPLMTKLS